MRTRKLFLTALVLTLLGLHRSTAQADWATTWGCAPQWVEPGNFPPTPLANSTLRQFVRASVGGKNIRVRLANIFATNPVVIRSAHIALAAGKGSAGNGEINPATDKALTFHCAEEITIGAGETIYSDPVDFALPPLADVAVSIYFGDISATTITGHPGSRTTSFIIASNCVSAETLPDAKKTPHWYLLTGLEVRSDDAKTLVVLGDSITDGRGSTTDGNNRWPDILAARLQANAPTKNIGVVNVGIGGNAIFGGLGPAAAKRFDRDVLEQSGVKWVIVFEGVNDIGGARGERAVTLATDLISAYTEFAGKAHAKKIKVYGATITPFGGNGYFSPEHEAIRQQVNAWIRTNSIYDGVIDFDAAVRDPADEKKFKAEFHPGLNANDWLHLNPAGYRALGEAVDLNLFKP